MSTIVITGIRSRLAQLVAGVLQAQSDVRIIGVDREPPPTPLDIEFRSLELRGTHILDLLQETGAQTVIHLAQLGEEQALVGREMAVSGNVMTTIELLGACVTAKVRRVVLRDSIFAYGARYDQPMFLSESAPLQITGRLSPFKDYVEIARFVADFSVKHPNISIITLRCAGLIGQGVSSPLMRYLNQPNPRVMFGFDPIIQVLHHDDAAIALALAALTPEDCGVLHVAADMPVTLAHAIRMTGRQPIPLLNPAFDAARILGETISFAVGALPFDPLFLRYPCTVDTSKARSVLNFAPQYDSYTALRELASIGTTTEQSLNEEQLTPSG